MGLRRAIVSRLGRDLLDEAAAAAAEKSARKVLGESAKGWPIRRKVIVNLKSGGSLRAILWERHASLLVLRQVEAIDANGATSQPFAEAIVERSNVQFIQVL